MWPRTTNTKGVFKSHYYSRSFLKYTHLWKKFKWHHHIMGNTVSQQVFMPQSKTSSDRNGLHLIGQRDLMGTSYPKQHRLLLRRSINSLQPKGKALLLKIPVTWVAEHGKLNWCPSRSLYN